MDIIKTIFKLSFFLLGCIMLMLALLVLSVGFKSFLWFFSFSLVFYILSYKYTIAVMKFIFNKFKLLLSKINFKNYRKQIPINKEIKVDKDKTKINKDKKSNWIQFNHENILINKKLKQIKLNTKVYEYGQIQKVELIANSKKVDLKQLKKIEKIKNIEIKIGTKIKKITYRHFKYNISKNSNKKVINNVIKDYKKLNSIMKSK